MNLLAEPWLRAQRGLHTVVLGLPLGEAPQELRVVRVSCDVPPTTLGPLLEARARIERALGTAAPFVEAARARVIIGLRRHLLGDLPSVTSEGSIVDVCNRLAALGPSALVLDAADAADAASLDMLRHILGRPGWLRLPIVLVMRGEALPMAAAQLVDAIRAASGEDAIVRAARPSAKESAPASHEASGPKTHPLPEAKPFDWMALPADVLRALRVLSIAGSGSEAQLVAAVLDTTELTVLDAIQRAADLGVPIEDRGEGRLHLPAAAIEALRATVLPSLAAALHRRVATILARDTRPGAPGPSVPSLSVPAEDAPRPGNAWDVIQASPPPTLRLPHIEDSARTVAEQDAERQDPSDALSTERSAARSTDATAARAADDAFAQATGRAAEEAFERAKARAAEKAGSRDAEARAPEAEESGSREAGDAQAEGAAIAEAMRNAAIDAAAKAEEEAARLAEERALRERQERAAEALLAQRLAEQERAARRTTQREAGRRLAERGREDEELAHREADAERASHEAAERAAEELRSEAERAAEEREQEAEARRSIDEAAERAAEEAAAHAAEEARLAREEASAREAAERRAAEEIASHAVERAQREIADQDRPVYYKPFTGVVPPPIVARPPGKWLSPLASEPDRKPARGPDSGRFASRDEVHDTPRAAGPEREAKVAVPRDKALPNVEDDARAARHLAAAGDADAAIERYLRAMQRAAEAAAYPQAVAHARAALSLLDRQPPSESRRVVRVQLLLDTGRVLWHGAGPDDSFTLQGALRTLESARTSLHAGDPAELVAEVSVAIAGILYEIGDIESLSRALTELSSASRVLSDAGEPHAAARLFNDQASVYIRMGDPVRAAHLLTESRAIFEKSAKTDPVAMIEMAETDHLFARILLHVPARPGKEQDALSLGLDHAIASERAFRRIGAPREVGRVLETMGRIEERKGRLARAAERITAAVQLQESIGDVVGLARSTEALARVMAAGGQFREALNLLADSIVLNFEKGSPLGLAYTRRALEEIAAIEAARASAGELIVEIESRLSALEEKLGRVPIPGTPDPAQGAAR